MLKVRFMRALPDFIILVVIFAVIAASFLFLKTILYENSASGGSFILVSEPIYVKFFPRISVGDAVYDNITKRKIGSIGSVDFTLHEGAPALVLYIDATSLPRGKSLFSQEVFFKFSKTCEAMP